MTASLATVTRRADQPDAPNVWQSMRYQINPTLGVRSECGRGASPRVPEPTPIVGPAASQDSEVTTRGRWRER